MQIIVAAFNYGTRKLLIYPRAAFAPTYGKVSAQLRRLRRRRQSVDNKLQM